MVFETGMGLLVCHNFRSERTYGTHGLEVPRASNKTDCFSDEDGFRKVPDKSNRDMLSGYIDQPLTKVPDPFDEYPSFGERVMRFMSTALVLTRIYDATLNIKR